MKRPQKKERKKKRKRRGPLHHIKCLQEEIKGSANPNSPYSFLINRY